VSRFRDQQTDLNGRFVRVSIKINNVQPLHVVSQIASYPTSETRGSPITMTQDASSPYTCRIRAYIVACKADAKVDCNVTWSNLRFFCDAFLKNEAARLLHLSNKPKTECAAERTWTSDRECVSFALAVISRFTIRLAI